MVRVSHGGLAVLLACGASCQAFGDEGHWSLGVRYDFLSSEAPPANDMNGWGFALRREGGNGWHLGFGLDRYDFDYEEPYKELGLDVPAGMEPIDGSNASTVVSAWIEKVFRRSNRWQWFWSLGVGYAFLSVDAVTGPTSSGTRFDVRTDARDEPQLLGSIGTRYRIGARWSFEAALVGQHHFTDYELRDAVSGRTGKVGSQTPLGATLGFVAQF